MQNSTKTDAMPSRPATELDVDLSLQGMRIRNGREQFKLVIRGIEFSMT